ncbi:MAG: hypothetical protein ABI706_02105 [Ilumatobacteraceae bacterium]
MSKPIGQEPHMSFDAGPPPTPPPQDKKLCADPNGDHAKQRTLHRYFVITGSISAFGAAILVTTWRRKPA